MQAAVQPPQFSVIVPAYGRPQSLQLCLGALAAQDYPREAYEVIVVDDGSQPSLEHIVAPFYSQMMVNYLWRENGGPAAARNAGVQKARFPFLAFTDDDCLPAPSWLSFLAQVLEQSPQAMVGGFTVNALAQNLYATASQLLIDYLYGYYNHDEAEARFFTSNNFSCSRTAFGKIGGFDPHIPYAAGEDREFCDRWRRSGGRMIYEPRARVFHYHHLRLKSFLRQHFNYGRGAWLFHVIRSRRAQGGMQVESFSFYRRLLFFPLKQSRFPLSWLLTWLMGLTQLANAAGFFFQWTAVGGTKGSAQQSLLTK